MINFYINNNTNAAHSHPLVDVSVRVVEDTFTCYPTCQASQDDAKQHQRNQQPT